MCWACPCSGPASPKLPRLGAAYLAGLATGFWRDQAELSEHWAIDHVFEPQMDEARREYLYAGWQKAVSRTRDWAE